MPIFVEMQLYDIPLHHIILDSMLVICIFWLLLRKKSNLRNHVQLTEKEKDELIAEWLPEPLVPSTPPNHRALNPKVIQNKVGKHVRIGNYDCVNMATHNYLGLVDNKAIDDAAIQGLRKYGVGSCGPRAFYGTADVHEELEKRLARFMHSEEAIVYSYGFCTIASAIATYAKQRDTIFADEAVNFAIQKGFESARCKIVYFTHNNVGHLQELLRKQADEEVKYLWKAKANRKFLVVEGIYMNTGNICPLPELVKLVKKHKMRIFVDESISIGALGLTGRGVTEYYGIPVEDIDLICSTLEYAFGSAGGFCVGPLFVLDHQRLSSLSYCFSASLPPLLAQAAVRALDEMEEVPEMFNELNDICRLTHDIFEAIPNFILQGSHDSPVKHLYLQNQLNEREKEEELLCNIVDSCFSYGVAFVVPPYVSNSKSNFPRPSIRLALNRQLEESEIQMAAEVLIKVSNIFFKRCLPEIKSA